jgi:hypothetical protein
MEKIKSFKVGDKVKLKRFKRPFWIHDIKSEDIFGFGFTIRVVDNYFDIGDEKSNWKEAMWINPNQIVEVITN